MPHHIVWRYSVSAGRQGDAIERLLRDPNVRSVGALPHGTIDVTMCEGFTGPPQTDLAASSRHYALLEGNVTVEISSADQLRSNLDRDVGQDWESVIITTNVEVESLQGWIGEGQPAVQNGSVIGIITAVHEPSAHVARFHDNIGRIFRIQERLVRSEPGLSEFPFADAVIADTAACTILRSEGNFIVARIEGLVSPVDVSPSDILEMFPTGQVFPGLDDSPEIMSGLALLEIPDDPQSTVPLWAVGESLAEEPSAFLCPGSVVTVVGCNGDTLTVEGPTGLAKTLAKFIAIFREPEPEPPTSRPSRYDLLIGD